MLFYFIFNCLINPFNKILKSSRAGTILKNASSFETIKTAVPEPSIFFWILASIVEVGTVIPNGA